MKSCYHVGIQTSLNVFASCAANFTALQALRVYG